MLKLGCWILVKCLSVTRIQKSNIQIEYNASFCYMGNAILVQPDESTLPVRKDAG